ncbi:MAG: hypothetical protein ACI35Q_03485 [Marinilabiliaceae bacterium]
MTLRTFVLSAVLASASYVVAEAQGTSYYEDPHFDPFQRLLYFVGKDRPHTAARAYGMDELRRFFDPDSVTYSGVRRLVNTRFKYVNSFFNSDFLEWRSADSAVRVAINPMCDFEVGQDKYEKDDKRTWTNSRGFYIDGNLGKNLWFYCDFTENQAQYAHYYANLTDSLNNIPGLSRPRKDKTITSGVDFQTATGYLAFRVGPYVDFLVGKTKTFYGDGYRSLMLSDAAAPTPTFRLNLNILRARYTMMVTQLRATNNKLSNNGEKTKYSFTHFLDWNMGRRFTFGIFENVTQATWRKDGSSRGIDWEYLNPFVIFRPGEYNAGSPDKMIIGLNCKFICTDRLTLYGQLMFNEFRLKELLSDKGWYGNKYAFQVGLKSYNLLKVDGLDAQFEYNHIRPYVYSQYDAMGCYTHQSQSVGHPLGANLKEGVAIVSYRRRRLLLRAQANIIAYGDDYPNDSTNFGHNPERATGTLNSAYGAHILQGLRTDVRYFDGMASFVINPKSMMNVAAGIKVRNRKSDLTDESSKNFYIALRWGIKSRYYDY